MKKTTMQDRPDTGGDACVACKPQKRSWLFGTGFCHVDTRYLARREIKVERPDRRRNDVRDPLLLRSADTYGYMGNLQLEFPPELCWPISAGVGYVGWIRFSPMRAVALA